jgi:two-component system OmpR family sensor kinase
VPFDLAAERPQRARDHGDRAVRVLARTAPLGYLPDPATQREQIGPAAADAGPGFPAEFLPHAFERFRRPDGGRARPDGGSGLGLAIVAAVAAAHGGSASARNGTDGGAIVTLDLPDTVQA